MNLNITTKLYNEAESPFLRVGAVMPSLRFRSRNIHLKLKLFLLIFNTLNKNYKNK